MPSDLLEWAIFILAVAALAMMCFGPVAALLSYALGGDLWRSVAGAGALSFGLAGIAAAHLLIGEGKKP